MILLLLVTTSHGNLYHFIRSILVPCDSPLLYREPLQFPKRYVNDPHIIYTPSFSAVHDTHTNKHTHTHSWSVFFSLSFSSLASSALYLLLGISQRRPIQVCMVHSLSHSSYIIPPPLSLSSTCLTCSCLCACAAHHHEGMTTTGTLKRQRRPDTVQVAGSRLPDCSHACGSCSPCRLVMVSFVCASIEEAETCPMAYKCMCNNKSYPVPWWWLMS